MEDKIYTSRLSDFYKDLLTEKQREYFLSYVNDDLSLSEIADISGISRQGVWDTIKKASKMLNDFESKVGYMQYYDKESSALDAAQAHLTELSEHKDSSVSECAKRAIDALSSIR